MFGDNPLSIGRPVQSSMAVIGDLSIGGTIIKADNLASTLQVCFDSGAKKVLLPQTSAVGLGIVLAELMSSFSLVFYQGAEDAVFKALGGGINGYYYCAGIKEVERHFKPR